MNLKKLLKTLKRFPKDAEVTVVKEDGSTAKVTMVAATQDELNQWRIKLLTENPKK